MGCHRNLEGDVVMMNLTQSWGLRRLSLDRVWLSCLKRLRTSSTMRSLSLMWTRIRLWQSSLIGSNLRNSKVTLTVTILTSKRVWRREPLKLRKTWSVRTLRKSMVSVWVSANNLKNEWIYLRVWRCSCMGTRNWISGNSRKSSCESKSRMTKGTITLMPKEVEQTSWLSLSP